MKGYPRYIVWENVPGAFSSNGGEDFKAFLEAVCSVKGGETDIVSICEMAERRGNPGRRLLSRMAGI